MYQSPDLKRVDVNVKDVFVTYGCPMEEFLAWNYTVPCQGSPEYRQEANTYVGMGLAHTCYATELP